MNIEPHPDIVAAETRRNAWRIALAFVVVLFACAVAGVKL